MLVGILFLLIFVILLISEAIRIHAEGEKNKLIVAEETEPSCPPHKWRHVEIKDNEGNVMKYKLACDLCGPFKMTDEPVKQ